jgi:putative Mg2+ transporter-C (MgtC) family protein
MPELPQALLRLAAAFAFSAVIGVERERLERPAGLRTHVLVGVGACLFMLVSVGVAGDRITADPGRVAAQVVTGMGFLGAGTIIRYGSLVRGLTTAASLWATSAIGLAAGLGWYVGAIATTGGVFLTLTGVRALEARMPPPHGYTTVSVTFPAEDIDLGAVTQKLRRLGVELSKVELGRPAEEERVASILVRPPSGMSADEIARALADLDEVTTAEAL